MNAIQAMMNGMSAQWKRERAETQMTLGKLIVALEGMPADAKITGLTNPYSYRGYYEDLAFEPREEKVKAEVLLAECRYAMGRAFKGYKGGNFVMGELTPVWVADYGCSGKKLVALNPDGTIETAEDA